MFSMHVRILCCTYTAIIVFSSDQARQLQLASTITVGLHTYACDQNLITSCIQYSDHEDKTLKTLTAATLAGTILEESSMGVRIRDAGVIMRAARRPQVLTPKFRSESCIYEPSQPFSSSQHTYTCKAFLPWIDSCWL